MTIPPDLEADPALLSCRKMARWPERAPAACAPRHRGAGLEPGWPAQDQAAGAPLAGRALSAVHPSLSAVHPSDPGKVPDADRQPPVRDGTRTHRKAIPGYSRSTNASRDLRSTIVTRPPSMVIIPSLCQERRHLLMLSRADPTIFPSSRCDSLIR